MQTAAFTLRGTVEQGIRWKRAADAGGFTSVGAWAAEALDAHLKHLARAGRPLPLYWRRGRFTVLLMDGTAVEVQGMLSPPFAHFRGTSYGPDTNKPRTLVCLRTGRVIATLRSARQCRELAAELAPVWLRDDQAAASTVERHQRESV